MSNHLILDFPVLQDASGDFVDAVSYEVTAIRVADRITVTHTLKGSSFVSQLVEQGAAKFSVRLVYRDSAERRHHVWTETGVCAEQVIPLEFSYAPEVLPSIIIMEDREITVNDSSGLTDFWVKDSQFFIPQYSRIALAQKLKFTAGDVKNLMRLMFDDKLGDGQMKVEVNEVSGEGDTPVTLRCGKSVHDQLRQASPVRPVTTTESMRHAIATQALCAVYAYMHKLSSDNTDYEAGGVLAAHLEMLEKETGESWVNDDFEPSLAATKMWPYIIISDSE